MNEKLKEFAIKAGLSYMPSNYDDMADLFKGADFELEKFAELVREDVIRSVIASILITEVKADEKGVIPTSEDYIAGINKDFSISALDIIG